ncbi:MULTISPECIES: rhodanese-like domain-containing protein [unclassified Arthrobacter]|uniref:rhodanese-like domain-containing protein n=1 Tax=unclassified Arthrobacter TaxID=235627 RepID=UPI002DFBD9E3|nr:MULTISPECIES: rhodanese-like domain-containing protein [unclassified Arthrobacter]MEC5193373.1 rhodanese-related sulfurtransferase [Arthrobacter sp. MP_M4]MEC5204839.1 rhodanese-related sulfurtransferase [Arthrobacter sp. MP_M7]
MKSISVDDLAALGSDVSIIDVREEEEYSQAWVPGTRNIPLSRFLRSLGEVPIGRTVYVMCASGGRSSQATADLAGQGYDAVNIMGGITEWYRNGHPVTYRAGGK